MFGAAAGDQVEAPLSNAVLVPWLLMLLGKNAFMVFTKSPFASAGVKCSIQAIPTFVVCILNGGFVY